MRSSPAAEDYADIRQAVRALCAGFPGEYWRALDRTRGYPTAFVDALTQGSFLAALLLKGMVGPAFGRLPVRLARLVKAGHLIAIVTTLHPSSQSYSDAPSS